MFVTRLVAGAPLSARRALIAAWRDRAASGEPWAVLRSATAADQARAEPTSDGSAPPRDGLWRPRARFGRGTRSALAEAGPSTLVDPPAWLETIHACLCCSPQPVIQAALARLARRVRPQTQLLIDLEASGRPATLIDVLRTPPLSGQIDLVQVLTVLDAGLAHQALAAGRLAWLNEQLGSADRLLLRVSETDQRSAELAGAQLQVLVNRLQGLAAFPLPVELWYPHGPEPEPGRRLTTQAGDASAQGAALWCWQAPPDAVFDRRALASVLQEARLAEIGDAVTAVFRTEREWYRYHPGAADPWELTLYRSGSRIEIVRQPGSPLAATALAMLQAERLGCLAQALWACRIGRP